MKDFEEKKLRLKEIRNKFLKFHKLLLDWDRAKYEREFGALSSGKFLEMLMGNERFAWLRTISTLIVRIDEAFDLDDGLSDEMLEGFYEESANLFDGSDEYAEFKTKAAEAVPKLPEAEVLRDQIIKLLD